MNKGGDMGGKGGKGAKSKTQPSKTTTPCKHWGKPGGCKYGAECQFAHSEEVFGDKRMCYNCSADDHVRPDCPYPKGPSSPNSAARPKAAPKSGSKGEGKTEGPGGKGGDKGGKTRKAEVQDDSAPTNAAASTEAFASSTPVDTSGPIFLGPSSLSKCLSLKGRCV